jgi:hypothetical protein
MYQFLNCLILNLFDSNLSDSEPVFLQAYPDSKPIWFRTCLFQAYPDSKPIGFRIYQLLNCPIRNLFDSEPIWLPTYLIPSLSGAKPCLNPNYLDMNLSTLELILFRTYLFLTYDSKPILFRTRDAGFILRSSQWGAGYLGFREFGGGRVLWKGERGEVSLQATWDRGGRILSQLGGFQVSGRGSGKRRGEQGEQGEWAKGNGKSKGNAPCIYNLCSCI